MPLSPAMYAIAVREALGAMEETVRADDSEANVVAYLGDTYLMGTEQAARVGTKAFAAELASLGLDVNVRKTKVWLPGGRRA